MKAKKNITYEDFLNALFEKQVNLSFGWFLYASHAMEKLKKDESDLVKIEDIIPIIIECDKGIKNKLINNGIEHYNHVRQVLSNIKSELD